MQGIARFLIPLALLASTTACWAQADGFSSMTVPAYEADSRFSSTMRVSVMGGADVLSTGTKRGMNASVLADWGRGKFSFETGVMALKSPQSYAAASSGSAQILPLEYVGIPLIGKFNYIERPMNAFSLKFGALGASVVNAGSLSVTGTDGSQIGINPKAVFGLAGFTGTTSLSDDNSVAMAIDGTYLSSITKADSIGTHPAGFFFGLGLIFKI